MKNIKTYSQALLESSNLNELNMKLLRASHEGNLEEVESLLDRGANVNIRGSREDMKNTPLHWAAIEGHTEVASLLLDRGANVDAEDYFKYTPLYIASERGNTEVVSLLLDSGAKVDAEDREKRTPLHRAVDFRRREDARLLILNGADALKAFDDVNAMIEFFNGDISWMPEELKSKLKRRVRSRGAFGTF